MKIENTTEKVTNNPMDFLIEALAFGSSGAIERMESAGQKQLTESAELPLRLNAFKGELDKIGIQIERLPDDADYDKPLARPVYEKLGIKVLESTDSLFVTVEMPEGWKVTATDHSMWNKLLDDKGRERGSIFYKAAFYDRDAFFNLGKRFGIDAYYPMDKDGNSVEYGKHTHFATAATDCGKPIHTVGVREEGNYDLADTHRAAAKEWLDKNYPDCENPFAYWE
jgi:hypothetical protein